LTHHNFPHDRENELLGALAEFPRVVASAAEFREPHRIARYLEELAGTYHGFYNDCRVPPMGDEKLSALHTARLLLCTATKQVVLMDLICWVLAHRRGCNPCGPLLLRLVLNFLSPELLQQQLAKDFGTPTFLLMKLIFVHAL
jgi:hypothetical protein